MPISAAAAAAVAMGSLSSKATRAPRKYPTRTPPQTIHAPHPTAQTPSSNSSSALDGQSPSYAASLRALGPVAPSAFTGKQVFPLAAQSPAVQLLEARRALAERVGKELEGGQREVRGFLDVAGVREVLTLRDKGVGEALIEQRMGLKRGTVAKVGGSEVVRVLPASGPLEVDI